LPEELLTDPSLLLIWEFERSCIADSSGGSAKKIISAHLPGRKENGSWDPENAKAEDLRSDATGYEALQTFEIQAEVQTEIMDLSLNWESLEDVSEYLKPR